MRLCFRIAAIIMKGKKLAPHTRMMVNPGSREVYQLAIKEGLIDILVEAGATIEITRRGKPVARIEPVVPEKKPVDVAALRGRHDPREGAQVAHLIGDFQIVQYPLGNGNRRALHIGAVIPVHQRGRTATARRPRPGATNCSIKPGTIASRSCIARSRLRNPLQKQKRWAPRRVKVP